MEIDTKERTDNKPDKDTKGTKRQREMKIDPKETIDNSNETETDT